MEPKNHERAQARNLFFGSDLTRQQIAALLNINRKTLHGWITEGGWKQLKYTASHAPSVLVNQYYHQLGALNRSIEERVEQPWPTKEEADTIRKLTTTINQIKKGRGGMAETVEVFETFIDSLRSKEQNTPLLLEVLPYMDKHVKSLLEKGDHLNFSAIAQSQRQDEKEYQQWLATQAEETDAPETKVPAPMSAPSNPEYSATGETPGQLTTEQITPAPGIPVPTGEAQAGNLPGSSAPETANGISASQEEASQMGSPSGTQKTDPEPTVDNISPKNDENGVTGSPGSNPSISPESPSQNALPHHKKE